MNSPKKKETTFNICELIPNTIQGEGIAVGARACFLRFAGCPLDCSWCDSSFSSWKLKENMDRVMKMTQADIHEWCWEQAQLIDAFIWTGGEPAIQPNLHLLTEMIHSYRLKLNKNVENHIETAGNHVHTHIKKWIDTMDKIIISPKPGSAATIPAKKWTIAAFKNTMKGLVEVNALHKMFLKTPISNEEDLLWFYKIVDIAQEYGYKNPSFVSVVTPDECQKVGSDPTPLLKVTREMQKLFLNNPKSNVRFFPQMHVVIGVA